MDRMKVTGGKKLQGVVSTSGAKNSALKLLFATILAEGKHVFKNVPQLKDVESTLTLLQSLGLETEQKQNEVSPKSIGGVISIGQVLVYQKNLHLWNLTTI